jgi:hypothetical protein
VDRHNEGIQIELLVVNDAEAVLVEVKSKLAQTDVDEHLERLAKFKRMLPRYADVRAMARSRRWWFRPKSPVTPIGTVYSCWRKPATA